MQVRSQAVEYRVTLGPGGIDLWLQAGLLATNLAKRFGGLRHSIRFESKGVNPEDFQVALFLLEPGLAIRYRIDSISITPLGEAIAIIETPLAAAMALSTLEVLRGTAPAAEVGIQRASITIHAGIGPMSVRSVVARFVRNEPAPFEARALTFEKDLGEGAAGTVLIEPSTLVPVGPDSAFIQIACAFPPTETPDRIQVKTRTFADEALRVFLGEGV